MQKNLLIVSLSIFQFAFAQTATTQDLVFKHYNLENKIAVDKYDVVSYFVDNTPKIGVSSFRVSSLGVIYYFANQTNKELFLKNPEKYKPQFGGWCAYAMGSKGEKVSVDPKTFKIIEGKLYLFYNSFLNNTLISWNKDEKQLMTAAESNWNKIINN